jgi:hypothetical protein
MPAWNLARLLNEVPLLAMPASGSACGAVAVPTLSVGIFGPNSPSCPGWRFPF